MTQWIGRAAITWSSTSETSTDRVHRLSVPLREVQPAFTQQTYTAESLDKTAIQTYTIGSGAHEFVGTVRFDDDPQSLLDLIAAGAQGTNLTYYPDLADPGAVYTCQLVSPRDASDLGVGQDPERGKAFGEGSVTLRLRQTDQSRFVPLYRGTDTLFRFRAGGSLGDATFTRADAVASYALWGNGLLMLAGSGKARYTHFDLDSDGRRETPAALLEATRTNLVTESQDVSSWTAVNSPTLTATQYDPKGGTTAYLVEDDSGVNPEYVYGSFTAAGTGNHAFSCFVKQGSAAVNSIEIYQASSIREVSVTWTNGVPVLASVTGSGTLYPVEKHDNGWYRILFTSTGMTAAAHQFRYYPAGSAAANTGTGYCWGAQAENAVFPSSYIPATGGSQVRLAERLYFPFTAEPQPMTVYVRSVELGTVADAQFTRIIEIGSSPNNVSILVNAANKYIGYLYIGGVATSTSAPTSAPTRGQVVEHLLYLSSAGVMTLSQCIAGGTIETPASSSAPASNPLPYVWGQKGALANRITLGANGSGTGGGYNGILNVAVVRGNQTMGRMREVAGL